MLNEENVRKTVKPLCFALVILLVLAIILIFAEVIGTPTVPAEETHNNTGFNWFLNLILIGVFTVIGVIISLRISDNEKKQLQKQNYIELSSKNRKIAELEKLNLATNETLKTYQFFTQNLELWKERALKCYPEIEHMVCTSFAQDEANNFIKEYPYVESLKPCHTNYSIFVKALEAYHKLSDEAKAIVCFNTETVKQNLKISLVEYIKFAQDTLSNSDELLHETAQDLVELNQIVSWYESLPITVKNKVSHTLVTSLMMKKANAEYQSSLASIHNVEEEISENRSTFVTILKNWFKKITVSLSNYFTRELQYEYQDEVLEEDEENSSVETNCDDTSENPNYI